MGFFFRSWAQFDRRIDFLQKGLIPFGHARVCPPRVPCQRRAEVLVIGPEITNRRTMPVEFILTPLSTLPQSHRKPQKCNRGTDPRPYLGHAFLAPVRRYNHTSHF